jgi:hypothetical protein
MQAMPAVPAVPAQPAAHPHVVAAPAIAAGGYATVEALRDAFLAAFNYEPASTVAHRKFEVLRCLTYKQIHDFTSKFNQLHPMAFPGMMAAPGGDEQM